MHAMVCTAFGDPEVLAAREVPDPRPGEHDLLVEVGAAGLNPIDFKIRGGAFAKGRKLPIVLGFDVCGVVREVGPGAEGFSPGDEIYASPSLVRDGANAELVCLDARTAAPKPRGLSDAEAAALPLVTITAWEALYERAAVEAGRTVLIQAGGGGVGHVAVQLAKRRGCRVLATASRPASMDLCRRCGAEVVIDHRKEDVTDRVREETGGAGCDVVLDTVGDEVFDRSTACLAVNGQLITIVGSGSGAVLRDLFVKNATLHFEMMGAPTMYGIRPEKQGRILREAARLVEDGALRPNLDRVIDLDDLAEGHRLQEAGHVTGKIVVRVK